VARTAAGRLDLAVRSALTAAALLLAIALVRVGVADVWFQSVKGYIGSGPLSPARIERLLAKLEPAIKLDPQNPRILGALGDIDYRRAGYAGDDLARRLGFLEKARDFYAAAVASQPNEGERWADMIYVYGDLIDAKQKLAATTQAATPDVANELLGLKQALEHASRLAPWSSYVLTAVVDTAKQHDGLLGPHEHQIAAAAQERMAEKKAPAKSVTP
jgi:tetratricopeptide (TPR) repeat protein